MSKEIETSEYAGPSKLGNSLAKGFLIAQLAAIPQLMGSRIMTVIVGIGGLIGGAVWGYSQADKAEKQFNAVKERAKDLSIENDKLKAEIKWADRVAERTQQKEPHAR